MYKPGTTIKFKTTEEGFIETRYTFKDVARISLVLFGLYSLLYFAIQLAA